VLKATGFEYRHQTLVHQLIVGAAFLAYLFDRDDVVWRFVKDSATPHRLERWVFIIAALLIAVGAGICTRARAYPGPNSNTGRETYRIIDHPRYVGEICYAIGFGSLAPLAGFLVLVGGEVLRVFRLVRGIDDRAQTSQQHPLPVPPPLTPPVSEHVSPRWKTAFRQEAAKWGILVTMTVFVITLEDRHAEVLAVASFLIGMLLNAPILSHSTGRDRSS